MEYAQCSASMHVATQVIFSINNTGIFSVKKKKDKTGHTEMHVALCYYDNIASVSLFHTDFHFISATTRPTPQ